MKLLSMLAISSLYTHIPQSLFSQFRYYVALSSRYYTVPKYKVISHLPKENFINVFQLTEVYEFFEWKSNSQVPIALST